MTVFKALALSALAFSPLSVYGQESMMMKGVTRFYIDTLDMVEYRDGLFNVFFYSPIEFDVFDICQVKRLRASKTGVYFVDKDIVNLLHQPDYPNTTPILPNPFAERKSN